MVSPVLGSLQIVDFVVFAKTTDQPGRETPGFSKCCANFSMVAPKIFFFDFFQGSIAVQAGFNKLIVSFGSMNFENKFAQVME